MAQAIGCVVDPKDQDLAVARNRKHKISTVGARAKTRKVLAEDSSCGNISDVDLLVETKKPRQMSGL
ncbi:hypothetical protein CLV88_103287 [Shimia abyssi]|uniref:Uncharacterized protein n=1 Tax=Shimia abyssi TaxID=1662395 RepID=A0A2P8FFZ1_9RHOB|nr:hypothetical protein CLV88_103287 [Shimia abyssi]